MGRDKGRRIEVAAVRTVSGRRLLSSCSLSLARAWACAEVGGGRGGGPLVDRQSPRKSKSFAFFGASETKVQATLR